MFGLIKLNPDLFWLRRFWWQQRQCPWRRSQLVDGLLAPSAYESYKHSSVQAKALAWLESSARAPAFFAFLPIIGDPLATVAGWL